MGLVVLALAQRKVGARAVLRRNGPKPQRADVVAARNFRGMQDLAPGENGIAREERRDVSARR